MRHSVLASISMQLINQYAVKATLTSWFYPYALAQPQPDFQQASTCETAGDAQPARYLEVPDAASSCSGATAATRHTHRLPATHPPELLPSTPIAHVGNAAQTGVCGTLNHVFGCLRTLHLASCILCLADCILRFACRGDFLLSGPFGTLIN